MKKKIQQILERLSSSSVLQRKAAIRELREYLGHEDGFMARLSLHYMAEHDPSYTVRNIARQAFYRIRSGPPGEGSWEKSYLFHKE